MKRTLGNWVALPVCVTLLALAQPAAAIVYGFDSLTQGAINGQDGWASNGLRVYEEPEGGGVPEPCTGLVLTHYGGLGGPYTAQRNNDGSWQFSLSGVTNFAIQNTMVMDYYNMGTAGQNEANGEYLIRNSGNGAGIGLGVYALGYNRTPYIEDALGQHNYGSSPIPNLKEKWDWRLEVDTTAYSGYGSGSLLAMKKGTHTTWQPVTGLQGISLKMPMGGFNPATADQIYAEIKVRLVGIDSLQVVVPSGTMTVHAFLDKNLDGVKDPFDEALGGWAYDVAGPCACGDCGLSPYAGTTDGAGQATVTGGTTSLPGLEDGDYATTVTRQDYYYAAGSNPTSVPISPGATNTNANFGFRPVLGDANIDGTVNLADFTILKANFGNPGGWAGANFNEDTVVNLADFTILKAHFGESHPDKLGGAAVPEPASAMLLVTAALATLRRRRRG